MAKGSTAAVAEAAGRRAAVRLLVLLLPAPPLAQDAGHPDNCHCPAAKPGIWALVLILGIVAALSLGYIFNAEVTLRRARKAAQARARERSRAAAWGYPPTAPPMPRHEI